MSIGKSFVESDIVSKMSEITVKIIMSHDGDSVLEVVKVAFNEL